MPISKVKSGSITDSAVTSAKINDSAVTSAKIQDGSIVNADINACAAIASSKLTVDTSALETDINTNKFNISLLGFKMAVNEGLTVFNLVDGVVDEFNDESGTDEAEGSNDTYDASNDFYANYAVTPSCISAGFSMTTITEPDTSVAGTNPAHGIGTFGNFTVPCGMTAASFKIWGAGGSSGEAPDPGTPGSNCSVGGGGGFVSGTLAVTTGQVLHINAGEGGGSTGTPIPTPFPNGDVTVNRASGKNAMWGGGINSGQAAHCAGGGGGGAAGIFTTDLGPLNADPQYTNNMPGNVAHPQVSAPQIYTVAGAGGGSTYWPSGACHQGGGAGGGLTGHAGGLDIPQNASGQTNNSSGNGGGGDQEQGGQGGDATGSPGGLLYGGASNPGNAPAGAGSGYYGGGGGSNSASYPSGGGGGSSYYGHPQISSGATEAGGAPNPQGGVDIGGGISDPAYVAGTNEGAAKGTGDGEDGYVLLTGSYCAVGCTTSTTIVSTAFTSTSVATSSRIVVFEENVDTPTLNTDIIASVSRDGGTTFTNATLSDSGYVTGSSGQRILTGQADISGQPSGQSMRWKLALANNKVKIHGVSLQWS